VSYHVFDRLLGFPTQHLFSFIDYCGTHRDVSIPAWPVDLVERLQLVFCNESLHQFSHTARRAGAYVEHAESVYVFGERLFECDPVCFHEVDHMDLVPQTSAVLGVIVLPEDREFGQLADRHLLDVRQQVVWNPVGIVAEQTLFVVANHVEVPQHHPRERFIRGAVVSNDVFPLLLGAAVHVVRIKRVGFSALGIFSINTCGRGEYQVVDLEFVAKCE